MSLQLNIRCSNLKINSNKCILMIMETKPSPFINWINTLRSFILLQQKVVKLDFQYFYSRLCNQDWLENYFSPEARWKIIVHIKRSSSVSWPYFKSVLVKNILSSHPVGFHYEDDEYSLNTYVCSWCKGCQYRWDHNCLYIRPYF